MNTFISISNVILLLVTVVCLGPELSAAPVTKQIFMDVVAARDKTRALGVICVTSHVCVLLAR